MSTHRQQTEHKTFSRPDETRSFPHGRAEILNIGNGEVGRLVFEPGWRWSESVKPIAKTDTCQVYHLLYIFSGRLGSSLADGTILEFGPGDVGVIPPGHDGWVIGDEACVNLDFGGSKVYAKSA